MVALIWVIGRFTPVMDTLNYPTLVSELMTIPLVGAASRNMIGFGATRVAHTGAIALNNLTRIF
ncbi:MAG: hypothetical protein IIB31_08510 [Chloroflexi bacterium]|nr:hypothetical protein [Chloroflexota bacterium]